MSNIKLPQINRIQIAGRLTRDPELTFTSTNKATCGFSVASDDGFGDKKQTYFFNCRAWDKQAERVSKLRKGAGVIVEGRMVNEKYKPKDGPERDIWKIQVGMVYELEWPDDADDQRPASQRARSQHGSGPRPRQIEEPTPEDDIPF